MPQEVRELHNKHEKCVLDKSRAIFLKGRAYQLKYSMKFIRAYYAWNFPPYYHPRDLIISLHNVAHSHVRLYTPRETNKVGGDLDDSVAKGCSNQRNVGHEQVHVADRRRRLREFGKGAKPDLFCGCSRENLLLETSCKGFVVGLQELFDLLDHVGVAVGLSLTPGDLCS